MIPSLLKNKNDWYFWMRYLGKANKIPKWFLNGFMYEINLIEL
jgi:hypothetical protein